MYMLNKSVAVTYVIHNTNKEWFTHLIQYILKDTIFYQKYDNGTLFNTHVVSTQIQYAHTSTYVHMYY